MIPGYVTEIRYHRTGADPGPFRHDFRAAGPVRMISNRDGSVTLRGRRRIWADDRSPDFDRYVIEERAMSRRRNPPPKPQQNDDLWMFALVAAVGLFLWNRGRSTTGTVGDVAMPSGTVWISDPYMNGTGEFAVGSLPPGPLPPWREASQYEISLMIPAGVDYSGTVTATPGVVY